MKKLLVSLIRDDLVYYKLLSGLNEMGLNPVNYYLYLSEVIFELLKIPSTGYGEKVFEYYMQRLKEGCYIDMGNNQQKFEELAINIYDELIRRTPVDK